MAKVLRAIICKTCGVTAMRPQNSKYCEPCALEKAPKFSDRNCRACVEIISDRRNNFLSWYCAGCGFSASGGRIRHYLKKNDNETSREITMQVIERLRK